MALIKCKECGQQMSSSARVCPHCGKQRSSTAKTGCAWIIVLFGTAVIWAIWKGAGVPDTSPVVSAPAIPASSTAEVPTPAVKTSSSYWEYRTTPDSMTSKPVHTARLESQNTVDFSFPYSGSQHATLILRQHPRYGRDVIFTIERGQFGCGVEGCTIMVRFDDGPAERYNGTAPDDHSSTGVFLSPAARFEAKLRKAKMVRIESTFYQQGRQVFTFDAAAFDDKQFNATDRKKRS